MDEFTPDRTAFGEGEYSEEALDTRPQWLDPSTPYEVVVAGLDAGTVTPEQSDVWMATQELKGKSPYELQPDTVETLYDAGLIDDRQVDLIVGLNTRKDFQTLNSENMKFALTAFQNNDRFTFDEATDKVLSLQENEGEDVMTEYWNRVKTVTNAADVSQDIAFGLAESAAVSWATGPLAPLTTAGIVGLNVVLGTAFRAIDATAADMGVGTVGRMTAGLLGTGVLAALGGGGTLAKETGRWLKYQWDGEAVRMLQKTAAEEYKRYGTPSSAMLLNAFDSLPSQPVIDDIIPKMRIAGGGDDVRLLDNPTRHMVEIQDVFASAGIGVHYVNGKNAPRIFTDLAENEGHIFIKASHADQSVDNLIGPLTAEATRMYLKNNKPEIFEQFTKLIGDEQWVQNFGRKRFWQKIFEADPELGQMLKTETQSVIEKLKSVTHRYRVDMPDPNPLTKTRGQKGPRKISKTPNNMGRHHKELSRISDAIQEGAESRFKNTIQEAGKARRAKMTSKHGAGGVADPVDDVVKGQKHGLGDDGSGGMGAGSPIPDDMRSGYAQVIHDAMARWNGKGSVKYGDDLFQRMEKQGLEPTEVLGELLTSAPQWVRANRKNVVPTAKTEDGARKLAASMRKEYGRSQDWEEKMIRRIEAMGGEMEDMSMRIKFARDFAADYEKFIQKRMKALLAEGDAALKTDMAKAMLHLDNLNRVMGAFAGMASETGRSLNILKTGKMKHAFDFESLSKTGKAITDQALDRTSMKKIMEEYVGAANSAERNAISEALGKTTFLRDVLAVKQMLLLYRTSTLMTNLVGTGTAAAFETMSAVAGTAAATGRFSDAVATVAGASMAAKTAFMAGNPFSTARIIREAMKTGDWEKVPAFWKTLIHRESHWNNFNAMHEGTAQLQDRTLMGMPIGRILTAPGAALQATDDVFKTYLHHLTINKRAIQMAAKTGKQGDDLTREITRILADPPQDMIDEGVKMATYGTFQSIKVPMNTGNKALDAAITIARITFLPFIPTLLGLVKYSHDQMFPVLNKQFLKTWASNDPGTKAEILARAGLAWSLFGSGILLAANGGAQGHVDLDKLNTMRSVGLGSNSVNVAGRSVDLGKMDPIAGILMMGVNFWQELSEKEEELRDPNKWDENAQKYLAAAFAGVLSYGKAELQTFYDKALFKQAADLIKVFDPDSNVNMGKVAADQLIAWTPGFVHEGYEFTGNENWGRWTTGFLDRFKGKFAPSTQAKFVHGLYGTEIEAPSRDFRVFMNSTITQDALTSEFLRHDIALDPMKSITPKVGGFSLNSQKLEPNDAVLLNAMIDKENLKKEGLQMIQSAGWKNLDFDTRRSELTKLRNRYRANAREKFLTSPRGQEIFTEASRKKKNTLTGESNPDYSVGLTTYMEGYGSGL